MWAKQKKNYKSCCVWILTAVYIVNVVDLLYEYVPWGLQNRVNDILYGGI